MSDEGRTGKRGSCSSFNLRTYRLQFEPRTHSIPNGAFNATAQLPQCEYFWCRISIMGFHPIRNYHFIRSKTFHFVFIFFPPSPLHPNRFPYTGCTFASLRRCQPKCNAALVNFGYETICACETSPEKKTAKIPNIRRMDSKYPVTEQNGELFTSCMIFVFLLWQWFSLWANGV